MSVDKKVWIGFDLGGTKMLCQVFDAQFNALSRNREKTRGHQGAEIGLNRISDTIRGALGQLHLQPGDLGGIGIGCPGPLDLNEGVILNAPNLGWKNVPIQAKLEQEFGCPVRILNDVDAGVYGEFRFGAGRDCRCVLGIFPGTGIGGGCVYEGEIIRGRTGSCMEVGHMQVAAGGPLCGCGRRGCLEAVASRLAISAAVIQAAYRGEAPFLMKNYGTDLAKIRSKALSESIANGDERIRDIVKNAARQIGIAAGNLVNLLLPDRIILGGGLVEAMPSLFVEPVKAAAQKRVMPSFVNTFDVVAAQLGDDSGVLGAAAWVQHVVLDKHVEAHAASQPAAATDAT
jgi:glucokinase